MPQFFTTTSTDSPWTTGSITINSNHITSDYPVYRNQYVCKEDLDEFGKRLAIRIYKIITEHTNIDISEEEFTSLLESEICWEN